MELCSTTQSILNPRKIPCHFRPKSTLILKETTISLAGRRLIHTRIRATISEESNQYVKEDRDGAVGVEDRIRATISEEPNQYVKEDRNGAVAVEDSPPPERNLYKSEIEEEEAPVNEEEEDPVKEFFNNFDIKFNSEDTYSVLLYASGALLALWLTAAVVGAIDSIPLFPKLMEVVGLGYTTWFTGRYLLFKKNRDELAAKVAELRQQLRTPLSGQRKQRKRKYRNLRPVSEAMDSVSHAAIISSSRHCYVRSLSFNKHKNPLLNTSVVSLRNSRSSSRNLGVLAAQIGSKEIDFSDPDWKTKYQTDFERRFNIPHITDVFPDEDPIPSTFCLKMRTPVREDFAGGYPSDEEWHGYINNKDRVLLKVINYSSPTSAGAECIDPNCTWVEQWVHRAGPREKIYFKPEEVKAAIVTCGGLCPGLNDVIRQIVITLEIYGVKKIVGIPFGYRGFSNEGLSEMTLSRKVVQNIHLSGGSLLGVSRGGPNVSDIVDSMEERGINMLFVLGGNGTHAGANAIHNECRRRRMRVAVVGVPKTIDNDILLMDKTFGFDTAVEEAQRAINSAYIEAHSAYHGIGIVKLMGRSSGFIAMHASLASGQIDICLIPEVPFHLHGPHGVLRHLKFLIETKGSAVICVAEGAGQSTLGYDQNFLERTNATDASGNIVFGDIGVHIQQEVSDCLHRGCL
ncbi:unnamed protein product [Dovyalis caffra]|uniref:Uncharacterized protein n=1 Tax=Dovyalis caffra TaxID=77055 RepID=A0AAV1RWB9_9ROSI|nr:unnamed protein product [Dovyalis caffra]